MMKSSRREFLGQAAVVATTLAQAKPMPAAATQKLSPFNYGDVQLLPGPLKRQFDQNHVFFLNLSEDRLLKIYRQRTGLPAPGEDMGGWYDGFCPGAHFGQYVSALARFGQATDSEPTRAKVRRLVAGYAKTVGATDKFFVDLRYPAYTYDKLVLGLIDAHSYARDTTAFDVLARTTQAAAPHMPDHALTPDEQHKYPHKDETYLWDESYTLAENLFIASERTGDRKYFDMGQRYLLDKTFFDPLSQGQNVLPGLHAYSHMNALSSGFQGYVQLGNPKYLRAVNNAVDWILKDQSFATGGWGPNEGFVEPGKGRLGASLANTHRSFETPCGSYAHFKLMRYLMGLTGDARYGDSMEQVLYNTVLGAMPIEEAGWSFYYSDYGHSGRKTDHRVVPDSPWPWDHDGRWPCCSGTLPQVTSDYVISAYFRGRDGVYVNLYVPSQLTWKTGPSTRCTLRQETAYPIDDLVTLHVEPSTTHKFSVYLRIPAWAGPQTSVSINGKRFPGTVKAGTFMQVRREWKAGNRIELEIDQPVTTRAVDAQTPDQVALLRGALVLFAMTDQQPAMERAKLASPSLGKGEAGGWTFGTVPVKPFYEIGNEVYQTYWKVV